MGTSSPCVSSDGYRKAAYVTHGDARDHRNRLPNKKQMTEYECHGCGFWHLTKKVNDKRVRANRAFGHDGV